MATINDARLREILVSSPTIAVTQDGIVAVSFFAFANNGGPNKTGWVKRYNR